MTGASKGEQSRPPHSPMDEKTNENIEGENTMNQHTLQNQTCKLTSASPHSHLFRRSGCESRFPRKWRKDVNRAIAGMLVALAGVATGFAQDVPAKLDDRPKITVTGEAVVNVKPDRIVLSFGIETSDQTIAVARQKNADAFKKAVAAIKECGIPEKDVQTDHLSIEPRYKDGYRAGGFLGYFVSNTVAVISNSPEKVEELVTGLLQAGVNHIHGIDFQTTEFKKHREQAREMALKAAREKAEKMASVLGQFIGSPIQISETHLGFGGYNSRRGGAMSQNAVQDDAGPGETTDTIALGKISIRAAVGVTFELRK